MAARRSTHIVFNYIVSLGITISLLVVWVVYVVRSGSRLQELGRQAGVRTEKFHWILLVVGCALFFLLLVGLTYLLAQALAARRYVRKQDEFVSNITHEMKSPLAAIKLHAQTLQHQAVDDAAHARSLAAIVQQTDRMDTLVDNVLESSRLVSQQRQLDLRPVDLRRFFDGYLAEAHGRVEAHGVALVPTIETGATILASLDGLHRVMDNLIDNAVRFSERGGEVRVRVADLEQRARIEVEDDGPGIPEQELPHIFERFYQAGLRGDRRRRGTGLGLSIVAGLVGEMGGSVRAETAAGARHGARFVIELPWAREER